MNPKPLSVVDKLVEKFQNVVRGHQETISELQSELEDCKKENARLKELLSSKTCDSCEQWKKRIEDVCHDVELWQDPMSLVQRKKNRNSDSTTGNLPSESSPRTVPLKKGDSAVKIFKAHSDSVAKKTKGDIRNDPSTGRPSESSTTDRQNKKEDIRSEPATASLLRESCPRSVVAEKGDAKIFKAQPDSAAKKGKGDIRSYMKDRGSRRKPSKKEEEKAQSQIDLDGFLRPSNGLPLKSGASVVNPASKSLSLGHESKRVTPGEGIGEPQEKRRRKDSDPKRRMENGAGDSKQFAKEVEIVVSERSTFNAHVAESDRPEEMEISAEKDLRLESESPAPKDVSAAENSEAFSEDVLVSEENKDTKALKDAGKGLGRERGRTPRKTPVDASKDNEQPKKAKATGGSNAQECLRRRTDVQKVAKAEKRSPHADGGSEVASTSRRKRERKCSSNRGTSEESKLKSDRGKDSKDRTDSSKDGVDRRKESNESTALENASNNTQTPNSSVESSGLDEKRNVSKSDSVEDRRFSKRLKKRRKNRIDPRKVPKNRLAPESVPDLEKIQTVLEGEKSSSQEGSALEEFFSDGDPVAIVEGPQTTPNGRGLGVDKMTFLGGMELGNKLSRLTRSRSCEELSTGGSKLKLNGLKFLTPAKRLGEGLTEEEIQAAYKELEELAQQLATNINKAWEEKEIEKVIEEVAEKTSEDPAFNVNDLLTMSRALALAEFDLQTFLKPADSTAKTKEPEAAPKEPEGPPKKTAPPMTYSELVPYPEIHFDSVDCNIVRGDLDESGNCVFMSHPSEAGKNPLCLPSAPPRAHGRYRNILPKFGKIPVMDMMPVVVVTPIMPAPKTVPSHKLKKRPKKEPGEKNTSKQNPTLAASLVPTPLGTPCDMPNINLLATPCDVTTIVPPIPPTLATPKPATQPSMTIVTRQSSSTPRRKSHIRALEFETPPRSSERKKSTTSPKITRKDTARTPEGVISPNSGLKKRKPTKLQDLTGPTKSTVVENTIAESSVSESVMEAPSNVEVKRSKAVKMLESPAKNTIDEATLKDVIKVPETKGTAKGQNNKENETEIEGRGVPPIATLTPLRDRPSSAWDSISGVGCVLGSSEGPAKSWDSDLRVHVIANDSIKRSVMPSTKRKRKARSTKKKKVPKVSPKKKKMVKKTDPSFTIATRSMKKTVVSPSKLNTSKRNTYSISECSSVDGDSLMEKTPGKDVELSPFTKYMNKMQRIAFGVPIAETPGKFLPQEETPLTKLLRENVPSVDIDLSMINTPCFPETPLLALPNTPFPSRPTDYSSSSSYYKPDLTSPRTPIIDIDVLQTSEEHLQDVSTASGKILLKSPVRGGQKPRDTALAETDAEEMVVEPFIDHLTMEGKPSSGDTSKQVNGGSQIESQESTSEQINTVVSQAKMIAARARVPGKNMSFLKFQMLAQCEKKLCENIVQGGNQAEPERLSVDSLKEELEIKKKNTIEKIKQCSKRPKKQIAKPVAKMRKVSESRSKMSSNAREGSSKSHRADVGGKGSLDVPESQSKMSSNAREGSSKSDGAEVGGRGSLDIPESKSKMPSNAREGLSKSHRADVGGKGSLDVPESQSKMSSNAREGSSKSGGAEVGGRGSLDIPESKSKMPSNAREGLSKSLRAEVGGRGSLDVPESKSKMSTNAREGSSKSHSAEVEERASLDVPFRKTEQVGSDSGEKKPINTLKARVEKASKSEKVGLSNADKISVDTSKGTETLGLDKHFSLDLSRIEPCEKNIAETPGTSRKPNFSRPLVSSTPSKVSPNCAQVIQSDLAGEMPKFVDDGQFPELSKGTKQKMFLVKTLLDRSDLQEYLKSNKSGSRQPIKPGVRKAFSASHKWLKHPRIHESSPRLQAWINNYLIIYKKIRKAMDLQESAKASVEDNSKQSQKLPPKKRASKVPTQQVDTTVAQSLLQNIDVDSFLSQVHGHQQSPS